jgi:cardiolipin synthase A/B
MVQELVITDGSTFFDQLVQDIDTAQKTVLLEAYIFNTDKVGKRLGKSLIQAAKRGVKIHILIDGAGSPFWGEI